MPEITFPPSTSFDVLVSLVCFAIIMSILIGEIIERNKKV